MTNTLEKKVYFSQLFHIYGKLLTNKQQELFIAYYEEDYSLQEIADEFGISRNAVHDALKTAIKNLENFEEVLGLFNKNKKLDAIIEKYQTKKEFDSIITELKEME